MNSHLKGFYKKDWSQRLSSLLEANVITSEQFNELTDTQLNLSVDSGTHMIENYIGNYSLPLGLGFHFLINDQDYIVPMAVEEPSVVAAASNGAKTIAQAGGFKTTVHNRQMIGQIVIKNCDCLNKDMDNLKQHKDEFLEIANTAYPSIVKRGGGARDIEIRLVEGNEVEQINPYLVLHLHVDTQEAMGANMLNTMLEALAPRVASYTSGEVLMSILTNYATESLVTAKCTISPDYLSTDGLSGEDVRDRIVEASKFAYVDPYRATTNNKGVMNGIDAVVIATGNDWRAIEAGVHAYGARDGHYRSLTKWRADHTGHLTGEITIPLPVATVGGSIGYHPGAKLSHSILGNPNAKELAQIIAAVGLAQNFSAIKALVTSGIQKGHMALQAKSLAINAGATGNQIEEVTSLLIKSDQMNLDTAKHLLNQLTKH